MRKIMLIYAPIVCFWSIEFLEYKNDILCQSINSSLKKAHTKVIGPCTLIPALQITKRRKSGVISFKTCVQHY